MLVKFGPMLGLMGTLIPMGPALVGLGLGDISSMAYNMQVAFATTVIGMLVSGIGLCTLQLNQRYYAGYLNDLEFLTSKITALRERIRYFAMMAMIILWECLPISST